MGGFGGCVGAALRAHEGRRDPTNSRATVHVETVEVALNLNPALAARAATGRSHRRVANQGESGRRFRTGRLSAGAAVGAWAGAPLTPPGTAALTAPSEYGFFRKDSATCWALPVSSLVCLALLYSLTARSRWPSRSKIFPR